MQCNGTNQCTRKKATLKKIKHARINKIMKFKVAEISFAQKCISEMSF